MTAPVGEASERTARTEGLHLYFGLVAVAAARTSWRQIFLAPSRGQAGLALPFFFPHIKTPFLPSREGRNHLSFPSFFLHLHSIHQRPSASLIRSIDQNVGHRAAKSSGHAGESPRSLSCSLPPAREASFVAGHGLSQHQRHPQPSVPASPNGPRPSPGPVGDAWELGCVVWALLVAYRRRRKVCSPAM